MRILSSLFLLSLIPVAACTSADSGAEDERDGTFSGKADGARIAESSPEARGILRVANELTKTQLREDVGLASRAVSGIVAFRDGDDAKLGTDDDVAIATLAELDRIPYVGATAFDRLLAYAEDNGYIEEASKILEYRYGRIGMKSTLTIRSDGFFEHTEQASPSERAVVKTEMLPETAITDLRQLAKLAAQGPFEESRGAPATLGSAQGMFVVYTVDGTEVPVQLIARDGDGDLYLDVTFNTSISAEELRTLVYAEVNHDMPR